MCKKSHIHANSRWQIFKSGSPNPKPVLLDQWFSNWNLCQISLEDMRIYWLLFSHPLPPLANSQSYWSVGMKSDWEFTFPSSSQVILMLLVQGTLRTFALENCAKRAREPDSGLMKLLQGPKSQVESCGDLCNRHQSYHHIKFWNKPVLHTHLLSPSTLPVWSCTALPGQNIFWWFLPLCIPQSWFIVQGGFMRLCGTRAHIPLSLFIKHCSKLISVTFRIYSQLCVDGLFCWTRFIKREVKTLSRQKDDRHPPQLSYLLSGK